MNFIYIKPGGQRKNVFCLTLLILILFASCKKFVAVDPPTTSITNASAFQTDATAAAVLTGVYTKLSQSSNYVTRGFPTISTVLGLSADELTLFSGSSDVSYNASYKNAFTPLNLGPADFWRTIYPYIYTANFAIEGVSASQTLTPAVQKQLLGEAKFLRAFFYFYLVNLYGDVPLILNTDYSTNSLASRTPKAQVYDQIISDLRDAQDLLANNYINADGSSATSERVRPNKWAATAMLARSYLYNRNWAGADSAASAIISNKGMYDTVSLNNVFLKNSKEAIWQLQPVNTGWNTEDGRFFILSSTTGGITAVHPVYISPFLMNAFDSNDKRKTNWINSYSDASGTYYYPYKYKVGVQNAGVKEYLMVLRLGEQYLIRAEAKTQENKLVEALTDLNTIRRRAGLPDTTANSQSGLLAIIQHERQVELFTEWGHRWFDLKRTNTIDNIMSVVTPLKGGTWETTDQLFPISKTEIDRDPNLRQNPGY